MNIKSKILNTKFKLSEKKREYFRVYKKKYRHDGKENSLNLKKNTKEKREHYHRDYQRAARLKVIEHYGGICACCGESNHCFLAIDHIKGNGNKHRKQIGTNNIAIWIIKNNFPEDMFQILCHNCNMAKQFYGKCPHKK